MKTGIQSFTIIPLMLAAASFTSCKKTTTEPYPPSGPPPPSATMTLLAGKTDSFQVQVYSPGVYDTSTERTYYTYDDQGKWTGGIDSFIHRLSDGRSELGIEKMTLVYNADGFLVSYAGEGVYKNAGGGTSSTSSAIQCQYANGRITKYTANGAVWTFAYDDAGHLTNFADPYDTMNYQYGGYGMTKMIQKHGTQLSNYDVHTNGQGRITQINGPDGEKDITYDAHGNALEVVRKNANGVVDLDDKVVYDDHKYVLAFTDLWSANKGFPPLQSLKPNDVMTVPQMNNDVSEDHQVPQQTQFNFQISFANTYDNDGNLIKCMQTGTPSKMRPFKSVYTYIHR